MHYIIVKDTQRLSRFQNGEMHFRKNDWYAFQTVEEAERFLNHVQGHAKSKAAALKLRIKVE